MITNDLKKELSKLNIEVKVSEDINSIEFFKDGKTIDIKIDTIRRIFLNSLVSHIDNSIN